jgi:hypothetical protein
MARSRSRGSPLRVASRQNGNQDEKFLRIGWRMRKNDNIISKAQNLFAENLASARDQ